MEMKQKKTHIQTNYTYLRTNVNRLGYIYTISKQNIIITNVWVVLSE